MKKLISIAALLVYLPLQAMDLNLTKGWQLIGATEDIDLASLNSEDILSIWGYDKKFHKWRVYFPNSPALMNSLPPTLDPEDIVIQKGEGFWIYAKNDVNISTYCDANVSEEVINEINATPVSPLNESEIDSVLKMREEEKLARDVYLTLYEKWGLQVFQNISKAEQRHMDAIKTIIEKYNLDDPVSSDEVGVFSNEDLQELYNNLVNMGEESESDALKVGATIEDLDIYDLQSELNQTQNSDIKTVYEHLQKGSENHMRAFVRLLRAKGDDYSPQYISQDYFNEILDSNYVSDYVKED